MKLETKYKDELEKRIGIKKSAKKQSKKWSGSEQRSVRKTKLYLDIDKKKKKGKKNLSEQFLFLSAFFPN